MIYILVDYFINYIVSKLIIMNTFSLKYLSTLLILALFSLSCNEDALKDDEENTLFLEHAALLEGTWKVKDASSVIKDGNAVNVFQNMSFVIGKYDMNEDKCSYTTDHQENKGTEVWPNSGTWKFNGQKGFRKATDKDLLLRNDNVKLSVSVSANELVVNFSIAGGFKKGNWTFYFVKQ